MRPGTSGASAGGYSQADPDAISGPEDDAMMSAFGYGRFLVGSLSDTRLMMVLVTVIPGVDKNLRPPDIRT